jgi:hypothetical protein
MKLHYLNNHADKEERKRNSNTIAKNVILVILQKA